METDPGRSQPSYSVRDCKLLDAVHLRQWNAVAEILQFKVSKNVLERAVKEGLHFAEQPEIIRCLLPHCTGLLLDPALKITVHRGLWEAASLLLQQGASDTQCSWVMAEACERATQRELLEVVLPSFFYNLSEEIEYSGEKCKVRRSSLAYRNRQYWVHGDLSKLVKRGMWKAVRYVLQHLKENISAILRQWIITEAIQNASDENLENTLISFAQVDKVFALRVAVRRHLWRAVIKLLETCQHTVTDEITSCLKWAVAEAFKHASDADVSSVLKYAPWEYCDSRYSVGNVDSLLSLALERGLWQSVYYLLQKDIPQEHICRERAIEEAMMRADDHILRLLLPLCTDNQADRVLAKAVERGLWEVVSEVLKNKDISDEVYLEAVSKGLKHADDLCLIEFIIPHCADDQSDTVLRETVRRGIWGSVRQLLKKRVSVTQRRLAIEEAVRSADDSILHDILPLCTDAQVDFALKIAVNRQLWNAAGLLLQREAGAAQRGWVLRQVMDTAMDHQAAEIFPLCLEGQDEIDSVLTDCVERGLWHCVGHLLQKGVKDSQLMKWTVEQASRRAHGQGLQRILSFCPEDMMVSVFRELVKRNLTHVFSASGYVEQNYDNQPTESVPFLVRCLAYWHVAFITAATEDTCERVLSSVLRYTSLKWNIWTDTISLILMQSTLVARDKSGNNAILSPLIHELTNNIYNLCVQHKIRFGCCKSVFQKVIASSIGDQKWTCDNALRGDSVEVERIQVMLSSLTFALQMTNRALQSELLQERGRLVYMPWSIIEHVDVSQVWEEVRRSLFQKAVLEKQWPVVKHLADHILYDDQRNWLMKIALEEKLWDVAMELADHGMTDDQVRRVHRQIAKHAKWDTVLQLFCRGANLKQVREDLETANPSRLRPPNKRKVEEDEREYKKRKEDYAKIEVAYKQRVEQLKELERQIQLETMADTAAIEMGKWDVVLYRLYCRPRTDAVNLALEAAVEKATHVLLALVRLELNATQRDFLFSKVISHKLWAVGRALLERSLRRELFADFACWKTLQALIEEGQWTLVARIMEYNVGDDLRRKVMEEALSRREGSVISLIINCMDDCLTEAERERLFQQSVTHGLWQAVRRLVEENDSTGIAQRDKAMLAAIKADKWDIVEHCVKHGADIDKVDATGLTQLQQAVRKCKPPESRVKGLLYQGADQFRVDSDGNTVLLTWLNQNRAVPDKITEMLVEFHGDINQPDADGHNALYHWISNTCTDAHQRFDAYANILERALLWGRDLGQRVDFRGKTVLHVLAQERRHDVLRYVVARGGNPLAVTDKGESLLLFAVNDTPWPNHPPDNKKRVLVAECIKLGVSTHQPFVTDFWFRRAIFYQPAVIMRGGLHSKSGGLHGYNDECEQYSPLQRAFEVAISESRGGVSATVFRVLYYAGSCSNTELNRFYNRVLSRLPCTRSLLTDKLKKMATTPRSLQSLCRLIISHHVGVAKPRVRDSRVKQLPVLSKKMKDYVLFMDILDPKQFMRRYGRELMQRSSSQILEPIEDLLESLEGSVDYDANLLEGVKFSLQKHQLSSDV